MSDYTINDIESLSFKEGVRKRIAMYLGSADMQGVYNGIQEIISNSIDEYYMGYGTKIKIRLGAGNLITIIDEGRGIPFGTKEDGSNVLVDIFSKAHTGGKFNDKVYNSVAGLNGIGAKATCLSSLNFTVNVVRDGVHATANFCKGILADYKEETWTWDSEPKQGTSIQFIPDPEVYNLEPIVIDFDVLCQKCKNLSYLTKGLNFIITDVDGTEVRYCAQNGIKDLIKDNVSNPVHSTPIYYEMEDGTNKIEIALQWTKERENAFTFTNGLFHSEGGTSLTGLKTSITRNMNKICDKSFTGEMARTGLVYAVSCKTPNPSFANQTKTKINNPELRTLADRAFSEAIKNFISLYPNEFKQIKDFLSREEKAEAAADKARAAVLNHNKEVADNQKKKVLLTDKLNDCEEHGEGSILILAEGKSAAGSLRSGRDVRHMAIMALRGKIIGALKNPIEDVLENEEVHDILIALGCGIGDNYNSKKLRYGKIYIATDGDADGYNIACLIIALFYKLIPQFLEEGRLCWLRAPLFFIKYKDKTLYAYNEEELNKMLKENGKGEVHRAKGLGELNPIDVIQSMLGPQQHIEQFIIGNKEETYKQIEMLMGSRVTERRKFIFDNIDFSKIEE